MKKFWCAHPLTKKFLKRPCTPAQISPCTPCTPCTDFPLHTLHTLHTDPLSDPCDQVYRVYRPFQKLFFSLYTEKLFQTPGKLGKSGNTDLIINKWRT